jgi:predicted outer membrane protein
MAGKRRRLASRRRDGNPGFPAPLLHSRDLSARREDMTTRIHRIIVIAGAALLAMALSAALAWGQASGAPTSTASYVVPTDSISGQSMLELIMRTNREAIRQARATAAATRSADTRRFAETVIAEHTAMLTSATALWDRLSYTRPDSSSTTVPVASDSGMGAGAVAAGDTAFDQAYAASQASALESLSQQLRARGPLVQDPGVRAFALELQDPVDQQLAAARELAAPPAPQPAP